MPLSAAQEPRRVAVDGGVIPVRVGGEGAPVFLLHGISANHSEWAAVAGRLTPDHFVVLPDLLGRGASEPDGDAGFGLDEEVDRLVEVLEVLGVSRPLVAGHSHGATLALALAARIPLAALLLVNPVTPWTKRPRILDLLRSASVRAAIEPILRTCRRPLSRYILTRRVYAPGDRRPDIEGAVVRFADPFADRGRSRALLRVFRDWEPTDVERLVVPGGLKVLVVAGAADRRIPASDAARWAARLGAECIVVEGAGHALTEEYPDRVAAILREMATAATRSDPEQSDPEQSDPEQRDR